MIEMHTAINYLLYNDDDEVGDYDDDSGLDDYSCLDYDDDDDGGDDDDDNNGDNDSIDEVGDDSDDGDEEAIAMKIIL